MNNRRIFTRQARRAAFDIVGGLLLIFASVALLLSYFDILVK